MIKPIHEENSDNIEKAIQGQIYKELVYELQRNRRKE